MPQTIIKNFLIISPQMLKISSSNDLLIENALLYEIDRKLMICLRLYLTALKTSIKYSLYLDKQDFVNSKEGLE